jgi:hypothetical protein
MTRSASPSVECCGLRCINGSLSEIDSARVMVAVPCQSVQRIALRYGLQAPHPIRQSIVGAILLGLGCFPLMHLIHGLRHGGVFIDLEAWLIPLPVAGGWALAGALKRGLYLEVHQRHGSTCRLAFDRDPEPEALQQLLASIERSCGVAVAREDFRGWG